MVTMTQARIEMGLNPSGGCNCAIAEPNFSTVDDGTVGNITLASRNKEHAAKENCKEDAQCEPAHKRNHFRFNRENVAATMTRAEIE